jgi:hypothetical protein
MSTKSDNSDPVSRKQPALPADVPLEQLVHDPSPEIVSAVASDPRLTEDLALSLLQRRDLPREVLELLHKHRSLARVRKVQMAIVMHPHSPRHVTLPTIRHLYAFELMQIALQPSVPPDIKSAAEETLIARLETISSGERLTLAKRGSGRVAAALLLDNEEPVMQAALANPQMTEARVVKALKAASGTGLLAPAVSHHSKWSHRHDVKAALLSNAHTPLACLAQFASELSIGVLKEVLRNARLAPNVKTHLKTALEKRSK